MALVKRIVDAKGGLDALKKVRTVVADAETEFQLRDGALSSTTRTYVSYPGRFRVDAKVAGADVVQVYNGGVAWVRGPKGVHEPPPAMRADFAASVRRDTIPMLIAAAEGHLAVRLLAEEGREGRALRVLEISGAELQPVRLYVDPQGLIARQTFQTPGVDGKPVHTEEIFSDYRAVSGVQVPFKAELVANGRAILTRTLSNVSFNTPIDDAMFQRPSD
jgi:hypothetical protein